MLRFVLRLVNVRGELFASTFSFGVTSGIRLVSSVVLTRLLNPAAYGVFGILLSLIYITELLSDVGTTALLIRHPQGGEVRFVHTLWTVRLVRSTFNFALLFLAAPVLARLYETPVLTTALRIFSVQFLLGGFESLSFSLAQRDRKARIANYAELIAGAVSTAFTIAMATIFRGYLALVLGTLLNRALLTMGSHFFYRNIGVRIVFDRKAIAEQFKFTRFVLPSSLLTIVLSQYDKLLLVKFFGLSLVGVYTIAWNMLSPVSGIIMHNARVILYARCAEYFRTNSGTARKRYYTENTRLLVLGAMLPALVGGLGPILVAILYDARYARAGAILSVIGLGAIISAFQSASENLLVASGRTHFILVGNVIRLFTVLPAALLGAYLFGFEGFLWCSLGATLLPLAYNLYKQGTFGLLNLPDELKRLTAAIAVFLACFAVSHALLAVIPPGLLHLHIRRH
jgi:lipopolysaccharide exporter